MYQIKKYYFYIWFFIKRTKRISSYITLRITQDTSRTIHQTKHNEQTYTSRQKTYHHTIQTQHPAFQPAQSPSKTTLFASLKINKFNLTLYCHAY